MPRCDLRNLTLSRSVPLSTPVSSAPSPFRNSQSYIQAIRDLSHLIFSRLRNALHQNDLIYRLTPEGRWNHRACQLAHQHTGSTPTWAGTPPPNAPTTVTPPQQPHPHRFIRLTWPSLDPVGKAQTSASSSGAGTHPPAAGTGNPEVRVSGVEQGVTGVTMLVMPE